MSRVRSCNAVREARRLGNEPRHRDPLFGIAVPCILRHRSGCPLIDGRPRCVDERPVRIDEHGAGQPEPRRHASPPDAQGAAPAGRAVRKESGPLQGGSVTAMLLWAFVRRALKRQSSGAAWMGRRRGTKRGPRPRPKWNDSSRLIMAPNPFGRVAPLPRRSSFGASFDSMPNPSVPHCYLKARVLVLAVSAASLLGLSAGAARAQPGPAEIGKQVPGFEIEALQDSERTITPSDFEGRYVLLNLWATWCAPCIEKLPALREARRRYSPERLAILNVSFDRSRPEATAFLEKREMPGRHARAGASWAILETSSPGCRPSRVRGRCEGFPT